MIKLCKILKSFGKNDVLKGIDLEINDKEAVAFLGANGAGKTTLIEIISGVIKPTSGDVSFYDSGKKVNPKIGVQFQDGYWPVGTRPIDLISFFMGKNYIRTEEGVALIGVFELENVLKKEMSSLSGGQRQRFNCFLSLLNKPSVLILDELVTGLDLKMQIKLVDYIKKWKDENNATLLIVSHTPEEVELLCDRVIILKDGVIYLDGMVDNIVKKYGSTRKMMVDFYNGNEIYA